MTPEDRAELQELRSRVAHLTRELEAVSRQLARLEGLDAEVMPVEVPEEADAYEEVVEPVPPPAPRPLRPKVSWEALIGGQGALWMGTAAVFIAIALGLAYAWTSIPPVVRILGGFALALGFEGAASYSRRRAQRWFAEGLAGAGLALAYLDVWTGYAHHGLFGPWVAFALMALVALAGIVQAVRWDAPAIGVLATLGGLMAPALTAEQASSPWPLLAYVAILNVNVLGVSLYKRWYGLGWVGFFGCLGLVGYGMSQAVDPDPWLAAGFMTVYLAEFVGTAVGFGLRKREAATPHDVLLLVAAFGIYGAGTYSMLRDPLGAARVAFPLGLAVACALLAVTARRVARENGPLRDAALGLAIFFATLAAPIQFDTAWLAVIWVAEGALLEALGVRLDSTLLRRWGYGVGVVAVCVAASLALGDAPAGAWPVFNPRSLPLAASVLASGFLLVWGRSPRPSARVHALWLVTGLTWLTALELYDATRAHALWWDALALHDASPRVVAAALGAIILADVGAGLAGLARVRGGVPAGVAGISLALLGSLWLASDGSSTGPVAGLPILMFATMAVALIILRLPAWAGEQAGPFLAWTRHAPNWAAVLVVWVATRVVQQAADASALGLGPGTSGAIALDATWLLAGIVLLVIGLRRNVGDLRGLALALFGLTAFKVLLVDLATLPVPARVAAAGGLGIVLIGTSWLYSRRRGVEEPSAPPE